MNIQICFYHSFQKKICFYICSENKILCNPIFFQAILVQSKRKYYQNLMVSATCSSTLSKLTSGFILLRENQQSLTKKTRNSQVSIEPSYQKLTAVLSRSPSGLPRATDGGREKNRGRRKDPCVAYK